jgi:hypothetical protein
MTTCMHRRTWQPRMAQPHATPLCAMLAVPPLDDRASGQIHEPFSFIMIYVPKALMHQHHDVMFGVDTCRTPGPHCSR